MGGAEAVASNRAAAMVESEDEAAAKLLASALFGTTRLGESPTLGDALYKYQQHTGGMLSAPDERLLLSAVGVQADSKTKKDETGLIEALNDQIRMSPDGRLSVHQVAIWILAYSKARARLYLALSKTKRRNALRADMTRAEVGLLLILK